MTQTLLHEYQKCGLQVNMENIQYLCVGINNFEGLHKWTKTEKSRHAETTNIWELELTVKGNAEDS